MINTVQRQIKSRTSLFHPLRNSNWATVEQDVCERQDQGMSVTAAVGQTAGDLTSECVLEMKSRGFTCSKSISPISTNNRF